MSKTIFIYFNKIKKVTIYKEENKKMFRATEGYHANANENNTHAQNYKKATHCNCSQHELT